MVWIWMVSLWLRCWALGPQLTLALFWSGWGLPAEEGHQKPLEALLPWFQQGLCVFLHPAALSLCPPPWWTKTPLKLWPKINLLFTKLFLSGIWSQQCKSHSLWNWYQRSRVTAVSKPERGLVFSNWFMEANCKRLDMWTRKIPKCYRNFQWKFKKIRTIIEK